MNGPKIESRIVGVDAYQKERIYMQGSKTPSAARTSAAALAITDGVNWLQLP